MHNQNRITTRKYIENFSPTLEENNFSKNVVYLEAHDFVTPYIVHSDKGVKMLEASPLFLRTVSYNCDTGKRKTEICTLTNRHQFVLDTTSVPLVPFLDSIPYLKSEKDQLAWIEAYRDNPSLSCTIIIEAEIITLKDYNDFYLKTGCVVK